MLTLQLFFILGALFCFIVGWSGKWAERNWISGGLAFLTVAWFLV